jgi:hypothetical protein
VNIIPVIGRKTEELCEFEFELPVDLFPLDGINGAKFKFYEENIMNMSQF